MGVLTAQVFDDRYVSCRHELFRFPYKIVPAWTTSEFVIPDLAFLGPLSQTKALEFGCVCHKDALEKAQLSGVVVNTERVAEGPNVPVQIYSLAKNLKKRGGENTVTCL